MFDPCITHQRCNSPLEFLVQEGFFMQIPEIAVRIVVAEAVIRHCKWKIPCTAFAAVVLL